MRERLRRACAALVLIAMLPMAGVVCAGECNRAVQPSRSSDVQPCHEVSTNPAAAFAAAAPERCSPFTLGEIVGRERFDVSNHPAPIADASGRARPIDVERFSWRPSTAAVAHRAFHPHATLALRI